MITFQEGDSAVFVSAVGSPISPRLSLTPSVEWLDAYSEIRAVDANEIVTLAEDEIDQIDAGDPGNYNHDGSSARRRLSRGQQQQTSRSHKRIPSDLSDMDFPKLDLLYGPHLRFLHEEVGKRYLAGGGCDGWEI